MDQQCHYVGLDVSLETTSICVIDDAGAIIWRGKCRSDPDTITAIVRQHAPGAVRVGLETGQLSQLAHSQPTSTWRACCLHGRPPRQGCAQPSDQQNRRQ